MLIINHRANNLTDVAKVSCAEIDVQIYTDGDVVVQHDIDGEGWKASHFLNHSPYETFFLDIKQNLPIHKLKKIAKKFEGRSLGLFDVPFPSAYCAIKEGLDVWGRLSEFEPLNPLFDKFWVDPLASWDKNRYLSLMAQTELNHKMIIASPELHGVEDVDKIFDAWEAVRLKVNGNITVGGEVVGLVTKHPKQAKEFFGA